MEVKLIAIREDNGEVILTVLTKEFSKLSLPCSFEPFLNWRHKESDKRIIELLSDRIISIKIQDSHIIEMSTKPRTTRRQQITGNEKQEECTKDVVGEQGAFTEVEKKLYRRQVILTHKRSSLRKKELETERILNAQLREEKRRRDLSRREGEPGGIAFCPYCHKVVQTKVYWQSGKRVLKCVECGYSIGYK